VESHEKSWKISKHNVMHKLQKLKNSESRVGQTVVKYF